MLKRLPAVLVAVLFLFNLGCAGVTINPNITGDALVLILEEAGYDLAYLGLKGTDRARLNRIYEAIGKAEDMVGEKDITTVVAAISEYVVKMPEFQIDDTYQFLVRRATNLLDKVVDIDITIPEDVENAEEYIGAFLRGGKDGIDDLLTL